MSGRDEFADLVDHYSGEVLRLESDLFERLPTTGSFQQAVRRYAAAVAQILWESDADENRRDGLKRVACLIINQMHNMWFSFDVARQMRENQQ